MTPKQIEYVKHRAAGLGQARAAVAAGYAASSAKVIASRMERMPEIAASITEAREAARVDQKSAPPEFANAEDYLVAVVQGTSPPDPLRISAARTLIAYQKGRQRVPVKSATPTQLQASAALADEGELLDQWAEKAAAVRARLKRA